MRAWSIFFVLIMTYTQLQASSFVTQYRSDLTQSLHSLLCQKVESPSPIELWERGVFDTQAEITWLYGEDTLKSDDLKNLALEQAESLQHAGHAYGLCNERHAWILTTHSPGTLATLDQKNLHINTSLLKKSCETFQLDLAPFDKNITEKILGPTSPKQLEKIALSHTSLNPGTISLTCYPFDSKNKGPELWSLLPLGKFTDIPIIQNIHTTQDLLAWIQSRRIASGLQQLQWGHPKLDALALQPTPSMTLHHPRAWLMKQKYGLHSQGLLLLGENRVKGKNFNQMAWLLWNSAQHRRLLLSPEAQWMSLRLEKQENEILLILFFARDLSLVQSRTLPRKTN